MKKGVEVVPGSFCRNPRGWVESDGPVITPSQSWSSSARIFLRGSLGMLPKAYLIQAGTTALGPTPQSNTHHLGSVLLSKEDLRCHEKRRPYPRVVTHASEAFVVEHLRGAETRHVRDEMGSY